MYDYKSKGPTSEQPQFSLMKWWIKSVLSCANGWIYSNIERSFFDLKDTTIIQIGGTLANQDVFWQVRRDFGKRYFGNSGRVLAIKEVFWKFKRDFGNSGRDLEI